MARRYLSPVEVELRHGEMGGAEPAGFIWRGRRYRIHRVELIWKQTGRWWSGEGETTLFRVRAALSGAVHPAGIYELAYRHDQADWLLADIAD